MNGVSKKLCITLIGVQAVVHLAQDAPDKTRYAVMVAAMIVVYKLVQCRIDVMKSKCGVNKKENEDE